MPSRFVKIAAVALAVAVLGGGARPGVRAPGSEAPVAASADPATVAFQDGLDASLQNMLDSVAGRGTTVVTTTAVLGPAATPSAADPAVAEQLAREAYRHADGDGGGVLGPDTIEAGPPTLGDDDPDALLNVINQVDEVRHALPGEVERLTVDVRVDTTAAPGLDLDQVRMLVSAAAGLDPARGDVVTVRTTPR